MNDKVKLKRFALKYESKNIVIEYERDNKLYKKEIKIKNKKEFIYKV